ncbi:MAG: hypothetical protein HWN68_08160 [Desulfobacterales bacterium]|nr:hypothetical protein [Desulfobacterales bacterium]
MEAKKQGISIGSQHGFVNIQFHGLFQGLTDVDHPDSKYITTITGPDGSVMHIINDSKGGMDSYASRLRSAIDLVLMNNPRWPDVIHATADAQDNRRETALDETKTAELWAKSEPRYWVTVIISEFEGYRNVDFDLFHTEMSNEELSRLVVLGPGRSIDDVANWYTASVIEQTFSKAEVKQLHAYFSQWCSVRLKARRASPPTNDGIGYGAIPVGGGTDFYTFCEVPDYSLPFKVWGYFDLRHRG